MQEAEGLLRGLAPSKALVSFLRAKPLLNTRARDFAGARQLPEEALSLARRLRSQRETALALGSLAEVVFATGRADAAMATANAAGTGCATVERIL